MNALRLNLVKIHDPSHDRKIKQKSAGKTDSSPAEIKTEEKTMTKTLKIEGMMCPHCEARVKKALESIDGVKSADVSHEKACAVVTLSAQVSDQALTKAVTDAGYKVKGIS